VDILYSDSLSGNVAFDCLMFMPEISNRMVFVNGKHPSSPADCCHVAVFVGDVKDAIVGNYLLNKSHVEDLLSYRLAFHLFFK